MNLRERYRGALLGLAAGDALGTTVEFRAPGSFPRVTEITGGGPFRLKPGQWTDDTSMALCLAIDQLERYVRWWRQGHLSSTGRCFNIGRGTKGALRRFEQMRVAYCGSTDSRASGNGSIMRLAPVPLAYARDPRQAVILSVDSSRTTHASRSASAPPRYLGGLIVGALLGATKELLSPYYAPVPGLWDEFPWPPRSPRWPAAPSTGVSPRDSRSGYVVATLEAALWAFARTDNFRDGALKVVNLGEDADTTGAMRPARGHLLRRKSGIPCRVALLPLHARDD